MVHINTVRPDGSIDCSRHLYFINFFQ